jgi:hypothetical protein
MGKILQAEIFFGGELHEIRQKIFLSGGGQGKSSTWCVRRDLNPQPSDPKWKILLKHSIYWIFCLSVVRNTSTYVTNTGTSRKLPTWEPNRKIYAKMVLLIFSQNVWALCDPTPVDLTKPELTGSLHVMD